MPSNKDVVQELLEIIRDWDESQSSTTNDPTEHLVKLCELFERETTNFLKQDPDPFDDRHPVTSKPDCALGQVLRALFKKDAFVTKLVNHYLRDNYFSSLGVNKSSVELNTVACRLLLDLLHGLDIPQVFRDSESTVLRIYSWAEKGSEPLRTYATGLLAAAMDIPDLATSFREQNSHLVPIILKRLWELKDKEEPKHNDENRIPERPFAEVNKDYKEIDSLPNANLYNHRIVEGVSPSKQNHNSSSKMNKVLKPVENGMSFSAPCSPKGAVSHHDSLSCDLFLMSPTMMSSDCSNSSWAEMSSFIVGTFSMFPLEKETKEVFMLKYLRPVAEYQESLGHVYEHHALDLVFYYMNLRHTSHARLSFEALRFLGSLLFHKKFCIEFVNFGGIQKLLQVPRPSLPADGVALCLWYLAYCEESIERTCLLPENLLTELVRYALWLLECSHQSSRMHSVMFFGMVFRFRAILEKFDEQDGLRKMLNLLSTLSIFQDNWDQEVPDEPNEVMMWQTVKQVCLAIKNYFEAHLLIKAHQLQRFSSNSSMQSSCSSLSTFQHSTPAYKAMNVTQETVEKGVEFLLEHLPYRCRWKPVEHFASLNGLPIFLKLIATVLNDSFSLNRTETAVFGLDTLYICSVVPSVQSDLCEKIMIPAGDDFQQELNPQHQEVSGYAILVACIPENLQSISSSPEVQKAALHVLNNCLCSPIHRPGSSPVSIASTGSTTKKKSNLSSEDVIKTAWDCVRNSNGIMYLLNLLHKKVPITDADSIRGLACRALVGLSRSDAARQIMSKLPIFSSGQLQLLMKEPILQDKRIEHVKFQRHALELIKTVSGRDMSEESGASSDVSIQSIHKANIVAQTKINYNKKQLLQLICNYLVKEGFESVAVQLQNSASLPPLSSLLMGPPRSNIVTPPGTQIRCPNNMVNLSNSCSRQIFPPNSATKNIGLRSADGSSDMDSVGSISFSPSYTTQQQAQSSIPIRIARSNVKKVTSPLTTSTPFLNPANSSLNSPGGFHWKERLLQSSPATVTGSPMSGDLGITLDRIVVEYLTNQHALCENPVVTCPTFDLFQPHRCPDSRSVRSAPINFSIRNAKQMYQSHLHSAGIRTQNRKFIYSRYRPSHVYRPAEEDEVFITCEFTPDDQYLLVGTTRGDVKMFNKYNDVVVAQETVHNNFVTSLVPHNSGEMLLTSCSSNRESALWGLSKTSSVNISFINNLSLTDCQHAEFTNSYDRILGTLDQTARIYDLQTGRVVSEFTPKLSNHYKVNKAALDPTDDLLLTDGVLFDTRSGKQIHKFDKINPILNGVFHRNGLEIISSSEIWDLRTFHLLRAVPVLSLCDVSFNHAGDVIFGITVGDDESEENAFETSFKTVDAADYSSIATQDVRRIVAALTVNQADTQIAVVETDGPTDESMESVVRVYDIGMTRQEEDEALDDDDDDDDDLGSDEESDDSDDQDDSQNEFERLSNQSEDDDDESDDAISFEFNSSFVDDEDDEDDEVEEEQEEQEAGGTTQEEEVEEDDDEEEGGTEVPDEVGPDEDEWEDVGTEQTDE